MDNIARLARNEKTKNGNEKARRVYARVLYSIAEISRRYMHPGVIEKVTAWNSCAQSPPNSTVPVNSVLSPVALPLTGQPLPALPLNLNPIELTLPFMGPSAKAVSLHSKSNVLPITNFLRFE
jgi:hypothetical protein